MHDVMTPPDMGSYLASMKRIVSESNAPQSSYLKFSKYGDWTAGQDAESMDGASMVLHAYSLVHGWIAFTPTSAEQITVPIVEPLPMKSSLADPPADSKNGWQLFTGALFACEETGETYRWTAHTHGGRKEFARVTNEMVARMEVGNRFHFPVVVLGASSYTHKEHGQIKEPALEIVAWTDVDGNEEDGPTQAVASPAPAPAPAPARRRPAQENPAPVQAIPAPTAPPTRPPARRARVTS